ncbi:MAG: M48 family metalloprotease, partial [Chlorobia bacterium]|nr:M48 family metalloprotease [Fimbriimonadaceae bacterium]
MILILEFFADRQDLLFLALIVAEITAIASLALISIRISRKDAATRYGLGLSALVLIALAAPATWMMQNSGWTTWAWERLIIVDLSFAPIAVEEPVSQPLPIWLWIWGLGVSAIMLKIMVGVVRVHLLRRNSFQLEKLSNNVAVYATDDAGPAVVGALRPAVLMPRKLLNSLSDEEIRDVLAHEFAHIAHRHLIVALFQRLLAAVYWPHPLIHLLNRELITAREEICDNAVLRTAGAARYARVLLRVAECRLQPRQFSASLGLFGPSTSLEQRVKSLLDPNRRIDSTMNKRKIVFACTVLALGLAAIAGARIQTQVVVPAEQETAQTKPATASIVSIKRIGDAKKVRKLKAAKPPKSKAGRVMQKKPLKPAKVANAPGAPSAPRGPSAPAAISAPGAPAPISAPSNGQAIAPAVASTGSPVPTSN